MQRDLAAAVPQDYAVRVQNLRARLGLTTIALADRLGVAFDAVSAWEAGRQVPSAAAWRHAVDLWNDGNHDANGASATGRAAHESQAAYVVPAGTPSLDFLGDPRRTQAAVEGEQLSYAFLANPSFATEISSIDPLPHQRIAVYRAHARPTAPALPSRRRCRRRQDDHGRSLHPRNADTSPD